MHAAPERPLKIASRATSKSFMFVVVVYSLSIVDRCRSALKTEHPERSEHQLRQVVTATTAVCEAGPVGAVPLDLKSGAVAQRVDLGRMPLRRASAPIGAQWDDMQRTLLPGWDEIAER